MHSRYFFGDYFLPIGCLLNGQPTLILWGLHDDLIPRSVADRFHHDLPNNTLIVYPNAGHVPMEEIPAQTVSDYWAWSVRMR